MEKGGAHHGILGGNYLVINPNATKEEQEMAFRYITFDYFTDDALKSVEDTINARKAEGKYFVPTPLEYFSDDSEYAAKVKAIYDKYDNVTNMIRALQPVGRQTGSAIRYAGLLCGDVQRCTGIVLEGRHGFQETAGRNSQAGSGEFLR